MGRVVRHTGRSDRSARSRRRTVRASLTASGVIPGYDLLYGSQIGYRYEEEVAASGYVELASSWWPTEGGALDDDRIVFRGDGEAMYRLADGTIILARLASDSIRVSVAAPSRDAAAGALDAFRDRYPASYVQTEGDSRVPITFWALGNFGPSPRLRRIESTEWAPIARNYAGDVRASLDELMAWREPQADGQLLLWQGPPGTGKTWALRALATEWSDWAEFHYITDPDSFFVDAPTYMVDVLLADSYQAIDGESGDVYEEDGRGKWRVLILEDTGELLSADAKEKYGQGLSRLLNVVDGMIGQGLRVLCLVTTNDELGDLNPAVRRPGRCAQALVFGPFDADEAAAWSGDPAAEAGSLADLYSRYGNGSSALEQADATEIAAVAEKHAPDGGYGETAYHVDGTVFWVPGDWTTNDEVDAAGADFLAVDGVRAFDHEAEAALPTGDGWHQVWPTPGSDLEAERLALAARRPIRG